MYWAAPRRVFPDADVFLRSPSLHGVPGRYRVAGIDYRSVLGPAVTASDFVLMDVPGGNLPAPVFAAVPIHPEFVQLTDRAVLVWGEVSADALSPLDYGSERSLLLKYAVLTAEGWSPPEVLFRAERPIEWRRGRRQVVAEGSTVHIGFTHGGQLVYMRLTDAGVTTHVRETGSASAFSISISVEGLHTAVAFVGAGPRPPGPGWTSGNSVWFTESHDGGGTWSEFELMHPAETGRAQETALVRADGALYALWLTSVDQQVMGVSRIAFAVRPPSAKSWAAVRHLEPDVSMHNLRAVADRCGRVHATVEAFANLVPRPAGAEPASALAHAVLTDGRPRFAFLFEHLFSYESQLITNDAGDPTLIWGGRDARIVELDPFFETLLSEYVRRSLD